MAALSIEEQIKDAVVGVIQGMELPGLPRANVQKRKIITDRENFDGLLPCVIVAGTGNKATSATGGTNLRDDKPYPIQIAALQGSDQSQTTGTDRMQYWMERIDKAFRHQNLSAISSVWNCTVQSDVRFIEAMWKRNVDACSLVFRFINRETRGA